MLNKQHLTILILLSFVALTGFTFLHKYKTTQFRQTHPETVTKEPSNPQEYWFLLHRKSNQEFLYRGDPGNTDKSTLIKAFAVKTGIPHERPTPLPESLGREYWLLIDSYPTENPETGPFFLKLDIPVSDEPPFGPEPYLECGPEGNQQCDWVTPGPFGLHGVGDDPIRLAAENPGSSGCIRHNNQDITYLFELTNQVDTPIRYYIKNI